MIGRVEVLNGIKQLLYVITDIVCGIPNRMANAGDAPDNDCIVCFVSKPRAFENFWPVIDIFLSHVAEPWPVMIKDYHASARSSNTPIICFGVYMSRMDSNIAEAVEPVGGKLTIEK